MKIRFLEPGNEPYKKSLKNLFTYDKFIRTPSNGILTLATILKKDYDDVYCYSESISKIVWEDVLDADVIFISIFTFAANRGYELANYIKKHSNATVVFGGLHATLNYEETIEYADYVLLGEGDETILPFTHALEKKEKLTIPGVVYKKDGFVIKNDISGVLIQSMYFIPGTPVYETHKDALLDTKDWSRCVGKVVHKPENISPVELQNEIITASATIYSPKRLFKALFKKHGIDKTLFIGEFFWQASVRKDLKKDIEYLKQFS